MEMRTEEMLWAGLHAGPVHVLQTHTGSSLWTAFDERINSSRRKNADSPQDAEADFAVAIEVGVEADGVVPGGD